MLRAFVNCAILLNKILPCLHLKIAKAGTKTLSICRLRRRIYDCKLQNEKKC
jgi:hypothetical protein